MATAGSTSEFGSERASTPETATPVIDHSSSSSFLRCAPRHLCGSFSHQNVPWKCTRTASVLPRATKSPADVLASALDPEGAAVRHCEQRFSTVQANTAWDLSRDGR